MYISNTPVNRRNLINLRELLINEYDYSFLAFNRAKSLRMGQSGR